MNSTGFDYLYWSQLEIWPLRCAIALAHDIDPRIGEDDIVWDIAEKYVGSSLCAREALDIALNHKASGRLEVLSKQELDLRGSEFELTNDQFVKASAFLTWAVAVGWHLPEALINMSRSGAPGRDSSIAHNRTIGPAREKKVSEVTEDKISCRALARRLWAEDPSRPIAQVIMHNELQVFGNARQYGEKTVRGWIGDLSPNPDKRGGRPKKKTSRQSPET